jgi:hypothetical protein
MAGLDLTAFDDILKIDYLGPVRDQLNNSSVTIAMIEKRLEDFQGKQLYLPLHTGRNFSIGSRAEDVQLPGNTSQGSQIYDNAVYTTSYQYGRIRVTGPTIKSSRNNKGAFIRAVDSEMRGVSKDLRQSVNRQVLRTGDGELTECDVTTASQTVNVNSTKYLQVGMVIDIVTRSTGAKITNGDSIVVATIPSATTFTITSTAVTTAATDSVALEDTYGDDIWGLEAIISTANPPVLSGNQAATSLLGGINRTTSAFWQASVTTHTGTFAGASGNALDQMQLTIDTADIATESDINLLVTSHALKRDYASVLEGLRRYPPGGEVTLSSGYKALDFNGMPLVADKDAETLASGDAFERIYFIDTSTMWLAHMGDWDWMQEDGSILSRVSGKDAYEAILFRYFNLVTDQPNANAALIAIS